MPVIYIYTFCLFSWERITPLIFPLISAQLLPCAISHPSTAAACLCLLPGSWTVCLFLLRMYVGHPHAHWYCGALELSVVAVALLKWWQLSFITTTALIHTEFTSAVVAHNDIYVYMYVDNTQQLRWLLLVVVHRDSRWYRCGLVH